MQEKQAYLDYIDAHQEIFTQVSDKVWEFAELSLMEHQSAALYCQVLEKEGFTVQTPVAGIDTAFTATYGQGSPVIGILAEYDALSGLPRRAEPPAARSWYLAAAATAAATICWAQAPWRRPLR